MWHFHFFKTKNQHNKYVKNLNPWTFFFLYFQVQCVCDLHTRRTYCEHYKAVVNLLQFTTFCLVKMVHNDTGIILNFSMLVSSCMIADNSTNPSSKLKERNYIPKIYS